MLHIIRNEEDYGQLEGVYIGERVPWCGNFFKSFIVFRCLQDVASTKKACLTTDELNRIGRSMANLFAVSMVIQSPGQGLLWLVLQGADLRHRSVARSSGWGWWGYVQMFLLAQLGETWCDRLDPHPVGIDLWENHGEALIEPTVCSLMFLGMLELPSCNKPYEHLDSILMMN